MHQKIICHIHFGHSHQLYFTSTFIIKLFCFVLIQETFPGVLSWKVGGGWEKTIEQKWEGGEAEMMYNYNRELFQFGIIIKPGISKKLDFRG